MARGDPIFYVGADLTATIITTGERLMGASAQAAAFDHVGVQVSDGDTRVNSDARAGLIVVEALPPAIRLGPHPLQAGDTVIEGWSARYEEMAREDALSWLISQVKRSYGYGDIIADAARVLKLPLAAFDPNTWDCSHTTFVYMTLAGERWLESGYPAAARWVSDPQQVTPADLYAYCHFAQTQKGAVA